MGCSASSETSCFAFKVLFAPVPARPPQRSQDEQFEVDIEQALSASRELYDSTELSAIEEQMQLQAVLERHNAEAQKVLGDGNCQFRALSVVLFGDEDHHVMIRKSIADQLRILRDRYEGFVHEPYDEYIERMACNGSWGDNVTLQAAADLFACAVILLTNQLGGEVVEVEPLVHAECAEPIHMTFLSERHYDAARLIDVC